MKKILSILAVICTTSVFADNFTGALTINTNSLASPYINPSANTLKDSSGKILSGYSALQPGLNQLSFNTVMKNGGYIPYNINFSLSFGGMGLDASSIGWTANGDTPGSSYTFTIAPAMYPADKAPAAGDYCIEVSVNGNLISKPVCSIAIQKGDSFKDDIWYDPDGAVNITVPGFLANSDVSVNVTKGSAQRVICTRATQWATPSCKVSTSQTATQTNNANNSNMNQVAAGVGRLF